MNNSRVIVALDFPDVATAQQHISMLEPGLCRVKVGMELFTSGGPALIESLVSAGFEVFLDLKFHDIPTTVAKACTVAARLGVWMVNVHAGGGRQMLQAARAAVAGETRRPLLVGVTVLTSLASADLADVGIQAAVEVQVSRLAGLCKSAGLDGVVCSAQEAGRLQSELGCEFILVTPGIRPAESARHDQKRTMTPTEAILAGSHYLVIGRPIFQAGDPLRMLHQLNGEIDAALARRQI